MIWGTCLGKARWGAKHSPHFRICVLLTLGNNWNLTFGTYVTWYVGTWLLALRTPLSEETEESASHHFFLKWLHQTLTKNLHCNRGRTPEELPDARVLTPTTGDTSGKTLFFKCPSQGIYDMTSSPLFSEASDIILKWVFPVSLDYNRSNSYN